VVTDGVEEGIGIETSEGEEPLVEWAGVNVFADSAFGEGTGLVEQAGQMNGRAQPG
jgi:hypothetical protein